MKQSLFDRLDELVERYTELTQLLSEPDILSDQKKFTALSKEYKQLESIVNNYNDLKNVQAEIIDSKLLLKSKDKEIVALAKEELITQNNLEQEISQNLQLLLVPQEYF